MTTKALGRLVKERHLSKAPRVVLCDDCRTRVKASWHRFFGPHGRLKACERCGTPKGSALLQEPCPGLIPTSTCRKCKKALVEADIDMKRQLCARLSEPFDGPPVVCIACMFMALIDLPGDPAELSDS